MHLNINYTEHAKEAGVDIERKGEIQEITQSCIESEPRSATTMTLRVGLHPTNAMWPFASTMVTFCSGYDAGHAVHDQLSLSPAAAVHCDAATKASENIASSSL